jgi:hypothetical protein
MMNVLSRKNLLLRWQKRRTLITAIGFCIPLVDLMQTAGAYHAPISWRLPGTALPPFLLLAKMIT